MKWTNKLNLPEPIYNAIVNSGYSKGNADFSVTELEKSPQERRLFQLFIDDIEKDISEDIWAMLGTAVHSILEKSSGTSDKDLAKFHEDKLNDVVSAIENGEDIEPILRREPAVKYKHLQTEQRLKMNLAGYTISGQNDLYNSKTLTIQDYKVTGVWKYMNNEVDGWTKQLNVYRYLFQLAGYPVKALQVVAIFKDWKEYDMYKENYPDFSIKVIDIPIWDEFKVVEYILERLKAHRKVAKISSAKELAEISPCTGKERWHKPNFAVIKKGNSKASKVVKTFKEAEEYVAGRAEYQIIDRTEYTKCKRYCSVAKFCKQYNPDIKIVEPKQSAVNVTVVENGKIKSELDDLLTVANNNTAKQAIKEAPKPAMQISKDAPKVTESISDILGKIGV